MESVFLEYEKNALLKFNKIIKNNKNSKKKSAAVWNEINSHETLIILKEISSQQHVARCKKVQATFFKNFWTAIYLAAKTCF